MKLREPIFIANFKHDIVALKKNVSRNRAHRASFNATFRCGNVLQVFESVVARFVRVALKSSRETYRCRPLPQQSCVKSCLE